MSYPDLPWYLRGDGPLIAAAFWLPLQEIAPMIPEPLRLVRIGRGRTLGGIFFNRFGPGSDVEYNKIAIAPALVRWGRCFGFYTHRMYVDNRHAMTGVYEASGIRKELADFEWNHEKRRIRVAQEGVQVCELAYKTFPCVLPRFPLPMPGLGVVSRRIMHFRGVWRGRLGLAAVAVEAPPWSPFSVVSGRRPLIGVSVKDWVAHLFYPIREMTLDVA